MEDSQKLIEEVMRDTEEDLIALGKVSKAASAGYVFVYDTITGDESKVNRNMLPAQLRKRREDGSLAFTTAKPKHPPKRGTLKCILHPDDPNRKHYDELGLATCPKDNLTSPYQVKRHMERRHRMEWATIEEERKEREKQEDRDFQERLLSRAVGVPDKKKKK